MRNTGSLEDRFLIRELYGFYVDANSRGDKENWLSCWTEDGRWKTGFFDIQGKQAISEQWDGLWQAFESMGFLVNIGCIHVEGDTARARIVSQEWLNQADGSTTRAMGYYEDELRRVDGVWLFASRQHIDTANETYSRDAG